MGDLLYDVIRVSATKAEFTGSKLKNGMFGWATDTNEFVAKDAGTYYFFKNFDDIEALLDGKEDSLGFTPEDEANKENTTIDNSTTKYPTVNLLKTGLEGIAYPYEDVREPTGFKDPVNVNLSYSTIDRKVTITGNPTVYYQGTDVSDLFVDFESEAHALGDNEYWLQYNGTAFEWTLTPDFKALLIALVYVNNGTICLRECHGFMHWETHSNLHNTVGCFLRSGGDISGYTLASTTEADRRPEISQTTVVDEDLPTVNALLSNTGAEAVYTQLYLDGADSPYLDVDNLDIVPLDGNTPYYNNFNTSTEEWEQVLMATNNSYQKIFVMATPASGGDVCQKGRYLFIQGQEVSTNLLTIQAITPADINLGLFNTGVPEFVYIGEIIIKYTTGGGGNWTITEVNKIRGTQSTQIKQATGNYLSSVATDGTIEGNGTIESPLSITDNITGTGTAGKLAKFTDGGVVGDSIVSESGTELTVAGDATIDSNLAFGSDGSNISLDDTDKLLSINGGTPSSRGANISLFGPTRSSFANEFWLRRGRSFALKMDGATNPNIEITNDLTVGEKLTAGSAFVEGNLSIGSQSHVLSYDSTNNRIWFFEMGIQASDSSIFGELTATDLTVEGDATVDDDLTVSGTLSAFKSLELKSGVADYGELSTGFAHIFRTNTDEGAEPFNFFGHLVLLPRTNASRSVYIVNGANRDVVARFDHSRNTRLYGDLEVDDNLTVEGSVVTTGKRTYGVGGGSAPEERVSIDPANVKTIEVNPTSSEDQHYKLLDGVEGQDIYIYNDKSSSQQAVIHRDDPDQTTLVTIQYKEIALVRFWDGDWRVI